MADKIPSLKHWAFMYGMLNLREAGLHSYANGVVSGRDAVTPKSIFEAIYKQLRISDYKTTDNNTTPENERQ